MPIFFMVTKCIFSSANPQKKSAGCLGLNHYFYPMSMSGSTHPINRVSTDHRSAVLGRMVEIDFYLPVSNTSGNSCSILLINDGQDLRALAFETILQGLYEEGGIQPFLAVGIHAGKERRMEYGTAGEPDYLGRGARAANYQEFIIQELIPFIHARFPNTQEAPISMAGFSLGGLSALDLTWNNPEQFCSVGVFSGSLWWRSLDQENPLYSDDKHRIMHQRVRQGQHNTGQRFFFQCGALDEEKDRNRNGIIDSIDDTLDMIEELVRKGIPRSTHIYYLELADAKHDVASWGRAWPFFLRWNYGK
jgi:enterochelin esterase-like enzyme